jgi:F0F1-type ATP synthase membrane subunit b/b'
MSESMVTFIYELANFVIFVALLGWLFVKPIREFLDDQTARNVAAEKQARENLAESESLREQLSQQRARFAEEAEQHRQSILQESRREAQMLLDESKRQIADQQEQLRREARKIRQGQLSELSDMVALATSHAVAHLLSQIDGPQLESALVESACRQLQANQPGPEETIIIECAEEPGTELREQIAQAAGRTSANGSLQCRIASDLIGGIRIRTSSGMIDHSIAGLSQFVEQVLQRELNHHA